MDKAIIAAILRDMQDSKFAVTTVTLQPSSVILMGAPAK